MAKEEPDINRAIATISKATLMLSKVNSVEDAINVRDQAAAIQQVLKKCQAAHIHLHEAAILKIRSEKRLGEILPSVIKHGGDRKSSCNNGNLTLDKLGLNEHESSRCQRIACIPNLELEAYFETCRAEGLEVTTAGTLRLWKALNRDEAEEPDGPFLPSEQQQQILGWLTRRRESWPDQFRPTFTDFVRRILEHMEGAGEDDGRQGADTTTAGAGAA